MFQAILGAVLPSLVGGLLGSKKGATDQVQSNAKSMDPRVEKMYFGADGQSGLLGDLNQWYGANKSGINPDMQAGLDHMKSVYQSPLATQGYERMANTGYDLMGRGVAENPFVTGNMPNFGRLQQQQNVQAPVAQQTAQQPAASENLGLSQTPPLSLSNNWATPAPTPAPVAPVAPVQQNTITDQDQFRQMYEKEMRRRDEAYWADPSNNHMASLGM